MFCLIMYAYTTVLNVKVTAYTALVYIISLIRLDSTVHFKSIPTNNTNYISSSRTCYPNI